MQPHFHHPMIPHCESYSQNSDVSNLSSYVSQRGNIYAPTTLHPKSFLAKLVGYQLSLSSDFFSIYTRCIILKSISSRSLLIKDIGKKKVPVRCTRTFWQLVILIFGHRGATNSTFVLVLKQQENGGGKSLDTVTTLLRTPFQTSMNFHDGSVRFMLV